MCFKHAAPPKNTWLDIGTTSFLDHLQRVLQMKFADFFMRQNAVTHVEMDGHLEQASVNVATRLVHFRVVASGQASPAEIVSKRRGRGAGRNPRIKPADHTPVDDAPLLRPHPSSSEEQRRDGTSSILFSQMAALEDRCSRHASICL